jgi:uncharacterized protein with GYD domain
MIIWQGTMTTYIALFSLTDAGIKAARDSPRRLDAAKKLLADMGGEMKQFYMVMGDFDLVGICEAPDDAVMARYVLTRVPAVVVLTLFAGLGFAAFFLLHGYLLGREYLELIAMRHTLRACGRRTPSQELGPGLSCRPHHFRLRRRPGFKSARAAFCRRLYDADRETPRII